MPYMGTETRFIRALLKKPVDRTPVWIMRQAGRYLSEYRAIRSQTKDFLQLCKTPDLACQVTLQPIERFPLDAAILFSDILVIPDALQLGLSFKEGEGPVFEKPVCSLRDIQNLPMVDPEIELRYVMDTIRLIKSELKDKIPLIGFAGSPWTVATYMVEGKGSKTFSRIKGLVYSDPEAMHLLLQHVTTITISYLQAQIQAGVDVIMLFDTWGGVLSPHDYLCFSLQYMEKITKALREYTSEKEIPVILFTKNGGQHLNAIADTGCHAVGVDWTVNLQEARKQIGHRVALQGNLDPAVLYASRETIHAEVKRVLSEFGNGNGHVFNLGHGVFPDTDPEKVASMIESVQTLSKKQGVSYEG